MPAKRESEPTRSILYVRELRLSLRNNSGAYGYSVMSTCTLAVLSSIDTPPTAGEVFLFVVGITISFALVEAIATRGFTKSLSSEGTKVVALGSSFNLVSIALAVGTVALTGLVVPPPMSWLIGPLLASVVYLLFTAIEMTLARLVEEARGLE